MTILNFFCVGWIRFFKSQAKNTPLTHTHTYTHKHVHTKAKAIYISFKIMKY